MQLIPVNKSSERLFHKKRIETHWFSAYLTMLFQSQLYSTGEDKKMSLNGK
jgi:hypothetical protein